MLLTRDQTVANIQSNLEDLTGVYWDNTGVLNGIVQDGYDEVAVATRCIIKVINGLNFYNNLVHYQMPNYIADYYKAFAIFNRQTNRWMEAKDKIVFNRFRFDWELSIGTPWFWAVSGLDYISFFPHYGGSGYPYTTSAGLYDIIYSATADILQATSVPQIPNQFQQILEYYGTAEALEMQKEYSKAGDWWEQYYSMIQELKVKISNQMSPDRMIHLDPQNVPLLQG